MPLHVPAYARQSVATVAPRVEAEIDLHLPAGTLEWLIDLQKQHGDIFTLATRDYPAATYVVASPSGAQQVLSAHHADYSPLMLDGNMSLVLGQGLLISEGDTWKAQRKLMQRCFHGDALRPMISRIGSCNAQLLERWRTKAAAGGLIDLTGEMLDLSVSFNISTLFGDDGREMLAQIGRAYLDHLTAPTQADIRSKLLFLKETKRVRALVSNLIARRASGARESSDLLAMMMGVRARNGEAMPLPQLVDEVMNILTSGHATVGASLAAVWNIFSRTPSVAARAHREVDRVLDGGRHCLDPLSALPYAKQVILEAMRIQAPAWIITHRATRDTSIGDFYVPAGSNVFVSPYLIHRHPAHWPQPNVFDPERFSAASSAGRHSHAYLPYSTGPRNCIGDDLSMQEMLMHFASVLREFTVTHVEGEPGDFHKGFLRRGRAPIYVKLERRS